MKAIVNKDECIACGLCVSICPEVFEFEADGKAGVVIDEVPKESTDGAIEAQEGCPTSAISVNE